jgi:CHASE3 domain sensor protein
MGRKSRRKAKLRAAARMAQGTSTQPVPQASPMATQVIQPRDTMTQVRQTVLTAQANRFDYVGPELRQIAIIAGALFILLFVLAFILQ